VRKSKLIALLDFYRLHNPYYQVQRVEIDQAVLDALPAGDDSSLIELQFQDAPAVGALPAFGPLPESVLDAVEIRDDANESLIDMRHVASVSERLPNAPGAYSDAFEAAARQLEPFLHNSDGAVIGVRCGTVVPAHEVKCSMLHPELFPFGRGDLDEDRRVPLGREKWLERLARVATGRFHSPSFVIKAYDSLALHLASKSAFVKVKLKDLSFAGLTAKEMLELIKYQQSCSAATRANHALPEPPDHLSETSKLLFPTMRSVVGAMPH
jgi:hypothetical protein